MKYLRIISILLANLILACPVYSQTYKRVVSSFVGADVIVLALLEGDYRRLLAVSPLAKDQRYSPIYDQIPDQIAVFGAELESLLMLKPDLVIVASYTRADWLKSLELSGVNILKMENFSSLMDIKDNIHLIGKTLGVPEKARSLVEKMDRDLSRLSHCPLKGKKVLNFNEEGSLFGKDTTYDDLLSHVGAINMAKHVGIKGWAQVPSEQLATMDVDFVIVGGERSQKKDYIDRLRKEQGWRYLGAVKEGRILVIPSRYLSSVTHMAVKALTIACTQAQTYAK